MSSSSEQREREEDVWLGRRLTGGRNCWASLRQATVGEGNLVDELRAAGERQRCSVHTRWWEPKRWDVDGGVRGSSSSGGHVEASTYDEEDGVKQLSWRRTVRSRSWSSAWWQCRRPWWALRRGQPSYRSGWGRASEHGEEMGLMACSSEWGRHCCGLVYARGLGTAQSRVRRPRFRARATWRLQSARAAGGRDRMGAQSVACFSQNVPLSTSYNFVVGVRVV
jgi:hypothetical protein